jgi:hypothetical protein
MAVTRGVVVQYETANGSVPAITLDQRNGAGASVAIGSATVADLLVLGIDPVRLTGVAKDAGTAPGTADVGKFWVPA